MSANLSDAFSKIFGFVSYDMTWERPGSVTTHVIKVANSNYNRNREAPEELTITGREFVITAQQLEGLTLANFKKGDRLVDTRPVGFGINVIYEIEIMKGFKGEILGFRVRTN